MEPNKKSQLGEFLDTNINLITVLGIFNGLSIYSKSLADEYAKYAFGFIFTFLSILIVFEILRGTKNISMEAPLLFLLLGLTVSSLFLAYLILKEYFYAGHLLLIFLLVGTNFSLMVNWFNNSIFLDKLENKSVMKANVFKTFIAILVLIITISIWLLFLKVTAELFQYYPKKKIAY